MQGICPAVTDLAVDAPGRAPVPSTLGLCEPVCIAFSPATRFQSRPIAGHGHVFQPQVDAHGFNRGDIVLHAHSHGPKPPVSDGILSKAAVSPFRLLQSRAFEYPYLLAEKAHACPFSQALELC
jgi:hypothetical protein